MAPARWTALTFLFITHCAFFTTINGQKRVLELDESDWRQMLEGEWMVEFYAPWCPACKGLQPVWKEFATWGPDLGIKVGQVDVTLSPGLSGRFMVTALPTIFHVSDGEFRQYKGTRDKDSFISFVQDKKWQLVDAIPGWKSPNSIQMSVVSSFFKLSQLLRGFHNRLMEEFGLPTWGSYLIFAVATIILGAILGLVLVCVIDLVYPPKPAGVSKPVRDRERREKDKISDDELADEDIKDDLFDDISQSEGDDDDNDRDREEDGADSGSGDQSNPSSPRVKRRKPRKAD